MRVLLMVPRVRSVTLALSLVAAAPLALRAQSDSTVACDGQRVSAVDIVRSDRVAIDRAHTPAFLRAVLKPLLYGTPTRAEAITPYLLLQVGSMCSTLARTESERLLRRLPYLADARVTTTPDGAGGVRVTVETTDDLRPVIGAGVRGSQVTDLELGSTSIGGSGQLAALRWRDGGAFRDYLGARYTHYHLLGGPNLAQLAYARTPLGSYAAVGVQRPFLTDRQRVAGFGGYLKDDGYLDFARRDGDGLSLRTARERVDAGVAARLATHGTGSWLAGALVMHEQRSAGDDAVRITDRGLFDTTAVELRTRYPNTTITRAGVVLGVRALTFVKATAFDGLESVQDVGRGVQLSTVVGRGVAGDHAPFLAGDLYTGVGTATNFVGVRLQAESRRDGAGWGNAVVSGRLAWYSRPSRRQTRLLTVEYAGASVDSLPFQLPMADGATGIRGYSGSRLSGARRLIARGERRFIFPGLGRAFGWGAAAFADAGQMWKGTVPFGESAFRSSAGLSLLAAVPRASRSFARVDVAYPLVKDPHAKGVDVRVSYTVAARAFWREPMALARVRVMNPTADVLSWP
jgi:hypothetical protein